MPVSNVKMSAIFYTDEVSKTIALWFFDLKLTPSNFSVKMFLGFKEIYFTTKAPFTQASFQNDDHDQSLRGDRDQSNRGVGYFGQSEREAH